MREKNSDLHGSTPDESPVALLIVDMLNDLNFPEGKTLLEKALPMATRIAHLASRARAANVPVIYVNDNYGKWRSDFRQQIDHVLNATRGAPLATILKPDERDYYVIKPKHSGFYETTLGLLLRYLGARTLVITGVCTEACVLFTANDAYLREFDLVIPPDGVASFCDRDHHAALGMMSRLLKAALLPTDEIDFHSLPET